jgi:hypothetical protein
MRVSLTLFKILCEASMMSFMFCIVKSAGILQNSIVITGRMTTFAPDVGNCVNPLRDISFPPFVADPLITNIGQGGTQIPVENRRVIAYYYEPDANLRPIPREHFSFT